MKVTSKEAAWIEVNKVFPTDYEKDYASSARAGYDIYRHRELNPYARICDLGNRLEVLTGEYGETVTNIWIEESKEAKPNMFSYEIFLTKSSAAAHAIARGFDVGRGAAEARVNSTLVGMVNEDTDFIPAIYQKQGFFYCAVELVTEDTKPCIYRLTVC